MSTLGRSIGDRAIQSEMIDEISHLRTGQQARIQSMQEETEFRRFFQFFRRIDSCLQILAGDDGPMIGEKHGSVTSGEPTNGVYDGGITWAVIGDEGRPSDTHHVIGRHRRKDIGRI
jgi:hypothetical protein